MMRVAILNLTTPFPELREVCNSGDMIRDWLSPAMPDADLTVHNVALNGQLPDLASFDGLVLSGSELGVYDDPPWMVGLRRLILEARDVGRSMVGICFGHQLMADTFGGRAEKAPEGVVVGVRAFTEDKKTFDAYAWHQDQVTKVPPGARIVGTAAHCPVAALSYDFAGYSMQYHPEYTPVFFTKDLECAKAAYLDPECADAALATIRERPVASDLVAAKSANTLCRFAGAMV